MSRSPPAILPIFRSRHQLELLTYLFVRAGHASSIADLEGETGIPQQTLSREVDRLATAGILATRRVGRTKLVEADQNGAYFHELRSLLLKTGGPARILASELAGVEGIDAAYIFGSWARRYEGEIGAPPRDLDVVVVGDANPNEVDAACSAAQRQLGMEVNPVVVSLMDWRSGRSGFVRQIRRGPLVSI